MVQTFEKLSSDEDEPPNIEADIIILGCSLPGIVTAHKLKRKFGDTMDIVVLDIVSTNTSKTMSQPNVAFKNVADDDDNPPSDSEITKIHLDDNVAHHFLTKYSKELHITLPQSILKPSSFKTTLNKVFQHTNGSTVDCSGDFHDFTYLNFIEKFELNQYQSLLDHSMINMFHHNRENIEIDRRILLYYDQTTMEEHLCEALLFSTSRDIMRTIVRLVCGASADTISVLFYLHNCYRTSSSRNHIDGNNIRLREKLLGYCRKRLASQLQQSIADITLPSKPIKEIRCYSDEQVILKTMKGDTNYVCNLLAMALRPDELHKIEVEDQLLGNKDISITKALSCGRAKKFVVQYEDNFWSPQGYSGDILSIKGPIIWAMEKPKLSNTGSISKYASLIGYLKATDSSADSKDAVLEQLSKLFGDDAKNPVSYKETEIADVFIPKCGDYVALRNLTRLVTPKYLEWGTLDIFADGDVASALEAGHIAYLHLLSCLRPQAQTYEDIISTEFPTVLCKSSLEKLFAEFNYKSSMRLMFYTTVAYMGLRVLRGYLQK